MLERLAHSLIGIGGPDGEPAATSSSGIASSSVMAASSVSGSQYGRGTRSVNLQGPRAARSVTAARSLGEAAVRCATMRMRWSLMIRPLPILMICGRFRSGEQHIPMEL